MASACTSHRTLGSCRARTCWIVRSSSNTHATRSRPCRRGGGGRTGEEEPVRVAAQQSWRPGKPTRVKHSPRSPPASPPQASLCGAQQAQHGPAPSRPLPHAHLLLAAPSLRQDVQARVQVLVPLPPDVRMVRLFQEGQQRLQRRRHHLGVGCRQQAAQVLRAQKADTHRWIQGGLSCRCCSCCLLARSAAVHPGSIQRSVGTQWDPPSLQPCTGAPAPSSPVHGRTSYEAYTCLLLQLSSRMEVTRSTCMQLSLGKGGSAATAPGCCCWAGGLSSCTSRRGLMQCVKNSSNRLNSGTQW